jgi:prolyl-tRNA synthetase
LKTEREKFAGALHTYCIEALMQDNKALQSGTSHNLGQNFSKVFDLKYQDEDGEWQHAWNTSWGVSTRLMGAVIMAHGDDNGLVLPPRLSPIQAVIVPIYRAKDPAEEILEAARDLASRLQKAGLKIKLDDRENLSPGFKYNEWELLGVPLRIELGPRDLQKKTVVCVKRTNREKAFVSMDGIEEHVRELLESIQAEMFQEARKRRDNATVPVDGYDNFKELIEGPGGFLLAHWCGDGDCEAAIQEETKATIRCLAFDHEKENGKCIRCGKDSNRRVHFARAY